MKKFCAAVFLLLTAVPAAASEKGLLDLARFYYDRNEYYSSITETMRYQFLYPQGVLFSESLLVMGKSYYKGGNKEKALFVLSDCYSLFTGSPAREAALFYSGLMRLESGSYNYAAKNFREYNYVYDKGIFHEEAIINLSLIYALTENYNEAEKKLLEYQGLYPEGRLKYKALELTKMLNEGSARPKKSLYAAGFFSAFLPGSGYFYTENYMLGTFSFLTNAALIYGIYDGYRKKSRFQMILFSVMEFSFYNYSIAGSIKSADEYNEAGSFRNEMLIKIKTEF